MLSWNRSNIEFICQKCGKAIKPGCKIGLSLGKVYCYRCGHNIELSTGHRIYAKADSQALKHLRAIGYKPASAGNYKEHEAKTATEAKKGRYQWQA